MTEELVIPQPKPKTPTKAVRVLVDRDLLLEYESTFKKKIWVAKERTMLLEQYMKDRLAAYKKNHPKR